MKSIHLFLVSLAVILFLQACGEKQNTQQQESPVAGKQSDDDPSLPFDKRLKQFIERKLNTRNGENYRLKIYEEHLNDDGVPDVLITVNRLENALKTAEEKNEVNKSSTIGFFGDHNYFIYYSSKTDRFSDPVKIASSPQRELGITFENISSSRHKDVLIDYSIRNSQFRKVFLFIGDKPVYAFHWKLYDGWGTDELEAYCFEFGTGAYSEVKDIIVYEGTMKNIGKDDDYYTIDPEIECTGKLVKRFFYNSRDGKYYTPN